MNPLTQALAAAVGARGSVLLAEMEALYKDLHRLDQTARLHRCHLQLLGLDEAVATALCTSRAAVTSPTDHRR